MQPNTEKYEDNNDDVIDNNFYSKAGSFFLTVASKVADNLRSTPTSPVKTEINNNNNNKKLGQVSEFGRNFTSSIKQSFSDMNLASYNAYE